MNSRLSRVAHFLEKATFPVSRVLHTVGQGTIVLMVLITVADVFLRYIFNMPILGSYEVTELMMVVLVFASVGYTMAVKGHVCVDLVVSRFPERVQAAVESITYFLALVLFSLVTWRNVLHAGTVWRRHDVSAELFIPLSPFVLFVALGVAVLCLVLLMHFFRSLARALQK
jgi:TRAP-type C4-dicarboxylate transport system permease small subunit